MLLSYLLVYAKPLIWLLPALMEVIGYVLIMGKMGKSRLFGIIPFAAQCVAAKELFRRWASYWKAVLMSLSLVGLACYIGFKSKYATILVFAAITIYNLMLVPLCFKLGKQFGKGILFRIGLILAPALFVFLLGIGKSEYLGKIDYDKGKVRPKWLVVIRGIAYVLLSLAEVAAFAVLCFFITLFTRPMGIVINAVLQDRYEMLSKVEFSEDCICREEELGDDLDEMMAKYRSRDHYVDPANAKNVVVMEYVIGSNLEDGHGSATLNLWQMRDATKGGDGLTFVVQAGGSKRWFADEIDNGSVGRYAIAGGRITKVDALSNSMCLSEPENLEDFIKWTRANYPADRYMLVFWDHGSGFSAGYGMDDLNEREGGASYDKVLTVSEIAGAIQAADMKFDLIGFDACLMQDVETACALEPYADYYLASQETEPANGWFYTQAFRKLAEEPGLSTEEFGKIAVSTYDLSNRAGNEGNPKQDTTLSLVDLSCIKPAASIVNDIYRSADELITDNPAVYVDISVARNAAHHFESDVSCDMAGFVTELAKADYEDLIFEDEVADELVRVLKTCVVCRNKDSAEGCNGLSISFPYADYYTYNYQYKQLKEFDYEQEESLFSKCLSIIMTQNTSLLSDKVGSHLGHILVEYVKAGYSSQEWFVDGFEDYDSTTTFVDIPLIETDRGYRIDLPQKTWDIIVDDKIAAYLVTENGRMYLGKDYVGSEDEDGLPLIAMDDSWVHINGRLVCYEAGDVAETEDGTVYQGTVKARLNGDTDIVLRIEWDPVSGEDYERTGKGHITGYYKEGEDSPFMRKGMEQLDTGDTLEFMFDCYDEEGKFMETGSYGDKITVTTCDLLEVEDDTLSPAAVEFLGVLTDVYKREFLTERMTVTIE